MSDRFVEVEGLTAGYGEPWILRDVSLALRRGERAALVGPSGCGKTTLLRCIAGLAEPRRGTIRIDGRVVADGRTSVAPSRRHLAMVFQNFALWPHLTAREQVRFVVRAGGAGDGPATADRWLERLRIGAVADRTPGELSGGEQARLALARAFASGAPLLLLDEPLRNLDPHLAFELRAEMRQWLGAEGKTVLLVTHDPRDAFAFCDSLLVLLDGRLVASGTPAGIWRAPPDEAVARLLGGGRRSDEIELPLDGSSSGAPAGSAAERAP